MSLNEDVVLALGWRKCQVNHYDYGLAGNHWIKPDGSHYSEGRYIRTPDFEHDIAVAWTLIELFDFTGIVQQKVFDRKWSAGYGWKWAQGDTAPEALCRAFLATRGD